MEKRQLETSKDDFEHEYIVSRLLVGAELPQISHSLNTDHAGSGLQSSCISDPTKSDEICFGMLKDVLIRINHGLDLQSVSFDNAGRESDVFATLELVFQHDRCDILARRNFIATMNEKTQIALCSLSTAALLRYTGMIPQSEIHENGTTAPTSLRTRSSKPTCMMAILVFGPRSIKSTLARDLSQYHLFLQHPVPMPPDIVYENPQYLSVDKTSFSIGAILPPLSTEIFQQTPELSGEPDQDEPPNFSAVIDSLPEHDYLGEVDVDRRISTALLYHQKEALNFVISRESIHQKPILWEPESFNSEQLVYRHIVTGLKSPKPHDMLGGILADGMGLGKTLTMISCIVSTLHHANESAAGKRSDKDAQISLHSVNSTLVIVPSPLLLDTWMDEIEKHVAPGTLSCYKYHGPSRKLPSSTPLPYDVVLSTYGTLAADFSRGGGVLSCFHWYRVVLDEAHVIRNCSTTQFKAVSGLSASIRWLMTGTPVQNTLDDLSSLVKFLRVPLLDDTATFRKHIEERWKTANGTSKPDYENLKLLLRSICLRRRSSNVLPSLGVTFIQRRPAMSEVERKAYDELAALCGQCIKAAVNSKSTKGGNRPMLTALLRMRIFCNTGLSSSVQSLSDDVEKHLTPSLLQQSGEDICVSCKNEVLSLDAEDRIENYQNLTHRQLKCEGCSRRAPSTQDSEGLPRDPQNPPNVIDDDDVMQDVQYENDHILVPINDVSRHAVYPSKLLSLLDDIKEHYSEDKSIIFSFWKRSLDLIGKLFNDERLVFGRVDGDIPSSQRKKVLAKFHDDPSVRVLLMTIGTGAVGLNNLSVANRVHILEPQWNPSVEDQAIGRVVRLGQGKKVSVLRYIMEKSIEEVSHGCFQQGLDDNYNIVSTYQSIESRQILKLQLALKGVPKSSNEELSESKRTEHLRALGKIIESTVSTQSAT
ncbi:hypothetical protein HD806DRAFT_535561 [Xylariaceae sp. AK1471]|nr:hypothetical protein HD806DRAFT_535561 [Xylariaceae sp. AK1471]